MLWEEKAIKNIKQKVIRSIELTGNPETNVVKYIANDKNITRYKHTVNDSELLRMIEAIDSNHIFSEKYGKHKMNYIEGVISVRVGYNVPKYNQINKDDGIIILEHWKWINNNEGKVDDDEKPLKPDFKLVQCLDEKGNEIREEFKRVIVGSGHNRAKKSLFIRAELLKKIDKILLGGIDELKEINNYPLYSKGYAKWNAYYGLASTDSKAVSYVPKIVVIDDFIRESEDVFDIVKQKKMLNSEWDGKDNKDKYIKEYSVEDNVKKTCKILPFDGAGLVSVECAKKWSEELEIANRYNKSYVPAAFQIRVIPGIKGNLYTFDIAEFAKLNGWVITDIKGNKHDLRTEQVDIILTKSQSKFINLFDNDIDQWRKIFDKPVIFYKLDAHGNETSEVECLYNRTFNISEYSEDLCDLKCKTLTAYQHWQTINNTDEEIKSSTKDTIEMLEKISTDVNEFLRFRSCTEEVEKSSTIKEWKRIPPYYRAALYATAENKKVIFADEYFKDKVLNEIKSTMNRALTGKLYVTGNYQVLTPDIYALAQYAFGKREEAVDGLLQSEEIYSAWWILKNKKAIKKNKDDKTFMCDRLALIRNPHIYMEARIAKVAPQDTERYNKICKWFKYQTTGILTDSYSTIPLALGTADFDGDHIATTNCQEYIDAVERARKNGAGNTVDIEFEDCTGETNDNTEDADISDIHKLMEFDALAYQNNIGTVIDKVTMLWGVSRDSIDSNLVRKYVKIMDIVGQLTIDAAKSGEFEAIPCDIVRFLKDNTILKPYFMKYLQKNERKKKREESAIENATIFCKDEDSIKRQSVFSEDDTNLNRICKHMEVKLEEIQQDVNKQEFDVNKFLKIFTTAKPSETSKLYITIREVLTQLVDEHSVLYKELLKDDSDDATENKVNHYKYFYINARNELLNACKLSEEKSISKVLNCLVYMCYVEKAFMNTDNAKNILWNCFEDEMIQRAKENYTDKDIDYSDIADRIKKSQQLKKRKLEKYLTEKPLYIHELEKKDKRYSDIIIREEDIKLINDKISTENLLDHNIKLDKEILLKRLYSVLMVISKRLESDRPVGKNRIMAHIINSFTIRQNSNGHINYSAIAKLCSFNDYQRKNIKSYIKDLSDLGAITISDNRMADITIRVIYDKIDITNNTDSNYVSPFNYKTACEDIIGLFKVA